jgi:hypothetical protein
MMIVEVLLRRHAVHGNKKLRDAVKTGNELLFRNLIRVYVQPYHVKILKVDRARSFQIFRTLIQAGVVPTREHLSMAIEHRSLEILNSIIEAGVVPTREHLSMAVGDRSFEMVESIIEAGVVPTREHLSMAVGDRSFEMVESIIEAGVVPTVEHLRMAVQHPCMPFEDPCRRFYIRSHDPNMPARDPCWYIVNSIIQAGVVPTTAILFDAVKLDHKHSTAIVERLLEAGATDSPEQEARFIHAKTKSTRDMLKEYSACMVSPGMLRSLIAAVLIG